MFFNVKKNILKCKWTYVLKCNPIMLKCNLNIDQMRIWCEHVCQALILSY